MVEVDQGTQVRPEGGRRVYIVCIMERTIEVDQGIQLHLGLVRNGNLPSSAASGRKAILVLLAAIGGRKAIVMV
jgi:hypothetical protein